MFPTGWALQKPVQTIDPDEFNRRWRNGSLIATAKRDGNRGHIITAGANTRIYSRNGTLDWTGNLPHIAADWALAPEGYLVDVELHTANEGTSAFQDAMNADPSRVLWSAFDLLRLDGRNAMDGYRRRKATLDMLMESVGNNARGEGIDFDLDPAATYDDALAAIETAGIEGLVVWDRLAPHALNTNGNTKRGQSWKIKIRQTEDLVVTGWNPNKGDPSLGAGSLELSRRGPDGRLTKAGKVGSFDKSFDRHAAMRATTPYIVEVSHYGIDENQNMTFPKIERRRDDLMTDYGLLRAA